MANIFHFYDTQREYERKLKEENNTYAITVYVIKIISKLQEMYSNNDLMWGSSTKGQFINISSMDPQYIKNCMSKIQRDHPGTIIGIAWVKIFKKELNKRNLKDDGSASSYTLTA